MYFDVACLCILTVTALSGINAVSYVHACHDIEVNLSSPAGGISMPAKASGRPEELTQQCAMLVITVFRH